MKKLIIFAFLPLILACNPEENDLVIIGKYTDNLHVVKIEPNIVIPCSPDGSDSIDLNADNNYDIKFIKARVPLWTGYAYATSLGFTNGVQIALSVINNYPDSLNVGMQINNDLFWTQSSSDTLVLASYAKSSHSNPIGNYRYVTDKYLGFKFDNRFGWIKLDNAIDGDLVVKEFAICE
jgi:hypothetical protein